MAGTQVVATRWRVGALALLLMSATMQPAGQTLDLRYLRQQTWTTGDGLPQDSVHQILQSGDGYLWLATEGGLARFDGVSFRIFRRANQPAMTSDDVCCLATDANGALLAGTADGVLRLREDRLKPTGAEMGLPLDALKRPEMALGGKVRGGDGSRWEFTNVAVTGTGEQGERREWRVGAGLPGSRVESLYVDRQGRGWAGTNAGVAVLNRRTGEAVAVPQLRDSAVLQTYEDREGDFWFGTEASGLHVLRAAEFRTEAGLAAFGVTAVVQASDGAVWVGTRRDGVRRVRGGVVEEPVAAGALTSEVVLALAAGDNGSVWVGTPDGLNRVDAGGRVRRITSADGLPDDYVQALAAGGSDGVWVGTRRGLVQLRGQKMAVLGRAAGLASELVGSLLMTRAGELWVGTAEGVARRGRDGRFVRRFERNGPVTAMTEDRTGGVWVADRTGLSRFAEGRWQKVPVTDLSGQASAEVLGLAVDRVGGLWLREEHGIGRVDLTQQFETADGRALHQMEGCNVDRCGLTMRQFGVGDGMVSAEAGAGGQPSAWRMADGEMWFATRRGVAVAGARGLAVDAVKPPVVIERVLLNDGELVRDGGETALPYGRGRLTIEYAGLSFTAPAEVRYRVMLDGFDKGWTDAGGRRSATYTNLPPGAYRFRVQAVNRDGVWNLAGAEVRFRVVPPFWRRWWFVLLMVLAMGGVAWLLYRLRLRRIEAGFATVLKERNRIAREIHDTLAQDFVGVSIQLDLVTQLLGRSQVDAAKEQVRQTRRLVMDGLAEARRSIWELRASATEASLPARMRKVAERYKAGGLAVQLKIGGAYRELADGLENEVVRIAQESLANVQRHAGVAEARVELEYQTDMLVLTVEDVGRGFAVGTGTAEGHYGLRGLRERAAEMRGAIEIQSEPGQGTTVRLAVPLPSPEKGSEE